jgi:hypothetical protein
MEVDSKVDVSIIMKGEWQNNLYRKPVYGLNGTPDKILAFPMLYNADTS